MASQETKAVVKHLGEAVAMEQSVLRLLDSMSRTASDPELERAVEQHKRTTRAHVERLQQRLSAYGASPPRFKQAGGAVAARVKGVVDVARREKPARSARDGFVNEQLEVASYELLERIATRAGDAETADVARRNRNEDEAMAGAIARRWDRLADLAVAGDGQQQGGGARQLAQRARQLVRNPLALAAGGVATGVVLARRQSGQGAQSAQGSARGGQGETYEALTRLRKQDLQQRASEAGIPVTRDMTKQELIEALEPRVER